MPGRPRLPVGTFGAIQTSRLGPERYRAWTRFRDWDGQNRQVTSTASSRNAAITALKADLAKRMHAGDTIDSVTAGSPFSLLAEAWLADLRMDVDRADSTKELYERELRTLVLPTFEHFTVREVTVGRIEHFLKVQRAKSYPRAKHSRTILSMVLGFAVRREIMLENGARMWEFAEAYVATRARMGLPPVQAEDIMYARAVEVITVRMRRVDLLTSRDVAAAVRSTKAVVRREERKQQLERLVRSLLDDVGRNGARYSVEADMENQARTRRGKSRVPVESLVVQLAMKEVIKRVPTSSLSIEDARSAARVVKLRVALSFPGCENAADHRIQRPPVG